MLLFLIHSVIMLLASHSEQGTVNYLTEVVCSNFIGFSVQNAHNVYNRDESFSRAESNIFFWKWGVNHIGGLKKLSLAEDIFYSFSGSLGVLKEYTTQCFLGGLITPPPLLVAHFALQFPVLLFRCVFFPKATLLPDINVFKIMYLMALMLPFYLVVNGSFN